MKTKRFIAMLLCLLMCVSMFPMAVFADEDVAEEIIEEVISEEPAVEAEEAAPAEEVEEAEEAPAAEAEEVEEAPAVEAEEAEEEAPAEEAEEAEEEAPAEEAEEAEEEAPAEEAEEEVPAEPAEDEEPAEEPETEEEENEFDADRCGEHLFWSIDGSVLTIGGTGAMNNYDPGSAPWYGSSITKIEIQSGVTTIGSYAFYGCKSVTSIAIPSGVSSIGLSAFDSCTALATVSLPTSVSSIGYGAFANCAAITSTVYAGSEAQWKSINIGGNNEFLTKSNITYAYSPKLAAPVLNPIANYQEYMKVSWSKVDGAEKYRVYWRSGTSEWKVYTETPYTVINVTGVKSGTNYTFMVRAIVAGGANDSAYSVAEGTVRLDTPTLTAANNTNGALLSWNSVAGASAYKVYYRLEGSSSWTLFTTTKNLTANVTGLTKGSTYEFAVLSYASGKTSGFPRTPVTVKFVGTDLAAPVISKVENRKTCMYITWNVIDGAEAYRIWARPEGGTWTQLSITTKNEEMIPSSALKAGVTYDFMVRCCTKDGKLDQSPYSGRYRMTMLPTPSITSIGNNGQAVTVKWAAVTGAVQYTVYYRLIGAASWTAAATVDKSVTSYMIKGMSIGKTYEFAVIAVKKVVVSDVVNADYAGYVYTLNGGSGSYILPTSNTKKLTNADLAKLSRTELALARNEIYARHGYIFQTPQISYYFKTRSWYKGTISAANWKDSYLNDIEKYNIKLIADYENAKYGGSIY